jgi:hypothetical protein
VVSKISLVQLPVFGRLGLGLQSNLFSSGFATKLLHAILIDVRTVRSAHLILLDFIF